MCKMYKKPFAKRARDTGAWLLAFQILAIMSIMTNCGILYLSPQVKYAIFLYIIQVKMNFISIFSLNFKTTWTKSNIS